MGPPRSAEEATLVGSLHDLNRAHGALQSQLQSLGTAAERQRLSLRRAEHDLLLLRSYNDNLVNSLRSAVVVTDAAGRLSSINRTARATLGLGDADLGKPFANTRLHLAMQAQHPTLIAQMDEQAVRFEAVSCDDPAAGEAGETGAGTCLLDVRVAPYRDEGGTPRGLLVVADDVTEAVQIKHQLLRSERLAAVGRLSAQVAHEIRNPLSAIGLNTELLEEEFVGRLPRPDGDEARELLRGIGTEVERLTEVTEAYLQLARLPRPQLRQVDVNQVVADLFVMLRSEMRAHAIGVDLDLASPAPRALLDPGQLRQALHNVVRNSREAMPQGGKLWVRTEQVAPSGIRILVDDTGGGIQETVRHRACEPFFSTKPAGTGLGLSLTQQILVEHGGSVQLTPWQSPNEAPGSRVELLFP
jgi:nitrogen fixation/metabolism regulation signal transduction histidine kinase